MVSWFLDCDDTEYNGILDALEAGIYIRTTVHSMEIVFVTGRAGRVFTRQTRPLHGAGGGMFRVIPALPPSGAHPHSFPGRAPFVTTYF